MAASITETTMHFLIAPSLFAEQSFNHRFHLLKTIVLIVCPVFHNAGCIDDDVGRWNVAIRAANLIKPEQVRLWVKHKRIGNPLLSPVVFQPRGRGRGVHSNN